MGKTRNNYLVTEHVYDDSTSIYDYAHSNRAFVMNDFDYEDYGDYDMFRDDNYECHEYVSNNKLAKVVVSKAWNGVVKKQPKVAANSTGHSTVDKKVPTLQEICVKQIPLATRVSLPPYFPGSWISH